MTFIGGPKSPFRNIGSLYGRGIAARARKPLLDYSQATLVRSTQASYLTSQNTFAWAPPNELRYEDRGDGYGRVPLLEGDEFSQEITGGIDSPRNFTSSVWYSLPGGNPVTVEYMPGEVGPDGAATVYKVTHGGAALSRLLCDCDFAFDVPATTAWWIKASGTVESSPYRIGIVNHLNSSTVTNDAFATDDWQRIDYTRTTVGSGSNPVQPMLANTSSGVAGGTVYVAAADMWENILFPLSHYSTGSDGTQRAMDDLSYPTGDGIPDKFWKGRWYVDIFPYFASNEMPTNERYFLFDTSLPDEWIEVRDSSGTTQLIRWRSPGGGGDSVDAIGLSWSRHQRLRLKFDFPNGLMTLEGFTVGNGTYGGTVDKSWVGGVKLQIGASTAGSAPFYGRMSEPFAF